MVAGLKVGISEGRVRDPIEFGSREKLSEFSTGSVVMLVSASIL